MNGTATTWFNTGTTANTTTVLTNAAGSVPAAAAIIISSATVPQALNITITDASGHPASTILTVLATPSITLAATQGVSGIGTVAIAGAGFTPGARVTSGQLISATDVVTVLTVTTPMTVGAAGTFSTFAGYTFTVPTVAAGTYTVKLTMTTPTETANATFTILGAASITASVPSAVAGTNVTLTVTGTTNIVTATLGGTTNLLTVPGTTFGSQTVPTTGANAYNLTTWFIVPATVPQGTYTILITDATPRTATTTFTVMPSITLSATTGLKGLNINIAAGSGFAVSSTYTVTFNGAPLNPAVAGTTAAVTGALVASPAFAIPPTALANNTIVVTDAQGNNATAYFALTTPTLMVTPATGPAGTTVQLIGNGFSGTAIFIQIGGQIVPTSPAAIATANFIAYATIPAGTPTGNVTITATDSQNNAASANFTVASGTASYTVNQATLGSTAGTVNPSTGAAQTSFARGSSVKFNFVLQTSAGSGSTVWRITLQQPDLSVLNIVSTTASVDTNPSTLSYTQLLPAGVQTGTWTANIQIFAADGATPLAVTAVTFTVT